MADLEDDPRGEDARDNNREHQISDVVDIPPRAGCEVLLDELPASHRAAVLHGEQRRAVGALALELFDGHRHEGLGQRGQVIHELPADRKLGLLHEH